MTKKKFLNKRGDLVNRDARTAPTKKTGVTFY